MTINIQDLLRELVSYTDVRSSPNISWGAKSILSQMRQEFITLEASHDVNKQTQMIELFIGGAIYALAHDDCKYHYSFDLYPKTLSDEVFKTAQDNTPAIEVMYKVGKQALLNLPDAFNGNIFKIEEKLMGAEKPIPFFPKLKENADKINLLVKFCIKYAENLDQTEVKAQDLDLIDLQLSDVNPSQTQVSSTKGSNISMQILGGFIVAMGVTAVATAFVILNAVTFGLTGLIVASSGVGAILGGVGLFAAGTFKKSQSAPDVNIDDSLAPVRK